MKAFRSLVLPLRVPAERVSARCKVSPAPCGQDEVQVAHGTACCVRGVVMRALGAKHRVCQRMNGIVAVTVAQEHDGRMALAVGSAVPAARVRLHAFAMP
jgi:hypothetical protein